MVLNGNVARPLECDCIVSYDSFGTVPNRRAFEKNELSEVTGSLGPSFRVLEVFGFIPVRILRQKRRKTKSTLLREIGCLGNKTFLANLGFRLYIAAFVGLSVWVFNECLKIINVYRNLKFHLLHAMVIVPVVTSTKVL